MTNVTSATSHQQLNASVQLSLGIKRSLRSFADWTKSKAQARLPPKKRIPPESSIHVTHLPLGFSFQTCIMTSSMEPFLKTGEDVKAVRITAKDVTVGDVIVFIRPGLTMPIVHRVIRMKRSGRKLLFYTKGDNAFHEDKFIVYAQNVLGKITRSKPLHWRLKAFVEKMKYPNDNESNP